MGLRLWPLLRTLESNKAVKLKASTSFVLLKTERVKHSAFWGHGELSHSASLPSEECVEVYRARVI